MTENPNEDPWVSCYKHKLLDFLKAPQDVDLSTVEVTSEFREGYDYLLGIELPNHLGIDVTWLHPNMPKKWQQARIEWRPEPDVQGMHKHEANIDNEEVVEFLNTLLLP